MGAQSIATLIAVYELFKAPIGWTYAMYAWLYATAWFVFNNFLKVGVIKPFRRHGLYT
jgi:H+-transporting ATPase